jgi:hypothetical protein
MAARLFLSCSLLAGLFVLHAGASAQERRGYVWDSSYLKPLTAAEKSVESLPPAAYARPVTHELSSLAFERAYVGDVEGAIAAFDLQGQGRPAQDRKPAAMPPLPQARAEEAIRAIVEQARSKQVVLINEAHHVPMHRAFTQKLAQELRKIGYTYLAAETFNVDADGKVPLAAPGWAGFTTGTFTRDPVFAEFVNAALADGWKLVPYEKEWAEEVPPTDAMERIRQREQGQARNLVERIFARDKHAKVLIHVGLGHLYKHRPADTGMPVLMGEYLHRMTGLEMLHVDQTQFYAHPDRAREGPLYAALIEKFPAREPFVLRSPDGSFPVLMDKQGMVDMQVIFPRYGQRDGRAEWLQTLAGRTPRAIPADLLPKQGRRVIKAFRTGGLPDAVPADVVLVEAGKPAPALMLPPGQFRFDYEE